MSETIISNILWYLEHKDFLFAGTIARRIHEITGAKESVIERRLRELHEDEKLERQYVQVDGKGPHVVQYKMKTAIRGLF